MKRYWTWPITLDLFLGGLGGGSLLLIMIFQLFFGDLGPYFALAAFVSAAALAIACFFLVFELGQPTQFLRVFVSATAIIKWGAVLISVALIFGAIYFATYLPWEWLSFLVPLRLVSIVIAGISGLLVMLYTGVLLASCKAHAFWASAALPVLFLVSGIALGGATCMLCLGVWIEPLDAQALVVQAGLMTILKYIEIVAVGLSGIILLLYVLSQRGSGQDVARTIAMRWTKGSFAFLFWGIIVFFGTILPFVLLFIEGTGGALVAAVLVLVCGLILRFMIVYSDGRRLVPGEKRFYERLPHHDAAFLTAWKGKENQY